MKRVYFQEEQKFNQLWIWILMAVSFMLTLGFIIGSMIAAKEAGDTNLNSNDMIIASLILVFFFSTMFLLMYKMKLEVQVTDEGIIYRFYPIILKKKMISKIIIESFEVRKYNAIIEYGGYGVRIGFKKWGKAYNVKGNIGMQLHLKDGVKILFGTQRPEAFKHAMDKMMEKV
jgi:hypothetical protein